VPKSGAGALRKAAHRRSFGIHEFEGVAERIADRDRPDLICIGTFPSILSPAILRLPLKGAINVHWSLLPRHRGPDPLFWTYVNDDRVAGVTLHWVDEGVDTGPIVLQREIALERGRRIASLYGELAAIGGQLFIEAIALIAAGNPPRAPQDERLATRERSRHAESWRIDFETWPAERVWHVLRGLGTGLVPGLSGTARSYKVERHERTPGTFDGARLFCRDGYVEIDPPRRLLWLRRAVTRLRRLTS
jgi:methionyl-tRNA formyltransferase